jgi:hypothetical protein
MRAVIDRVSGVRFQAENECKYWLDRKNFDVREAFSRLIPAESWPDKGNELYHPEVPKIKCSES